MLLSMRRCPPSVRVISAAAVYLSTSMALSYVRDQGGRPDTIDKEKLGKINISEIDHLYRHVTPVYVDYFGFCRSLKINAYALTLSV